MLKHLGRVILILAMISLSTGLIGGQLRAQDSREYSRATNLYQPTNNSLKNELRDYLLRQQNTGIQKVEVLNPEATVELRTPASEVEDALKFLARFRPEDGTFIRFFSQYAVEEKFRDEDALVLSFSCHSLIGPSIKAQNAGGYYPIAIKTDEGVRVLQRVPGSKTLLWIDLRDFNWTPQAWETMAAFDGHFAEPVVPHDLSGALRLLAGNAVVRSDWFTKQATNTMDQEDLGADETIYETLLYALNNQPKTIEEWRATWGLDLEFSQQAGNEFGALVTKSQAVGRHNRWVFAYRSHFGWLWETYDVTHQIGLRDYVEAFYQNKDIGGPPEISDAGEAFTLNPVQLLAYTLRGGDGALVNFADPTVARHMADVLGDARVRVPGSCMDCHSSGPIPAENTIREFYAAQGNLKLYDKNQAYRVQRAVLSDGFARSVQEGQRIYAESLKRVNGLTPVENGSAYLKTIVRYSQAVDLEKAAFECGVTPAELEDKVLTYQDSRIGGRLKLLVRTGEAIPRDVWESPGKDGIPGAFQQAMIMLNGVTVITEEVGNIEANEVIVETLVKQHTVLECVKDGYSVIAGTVDKGRLKSGSLVLAIEFRRLGDKDWVAIRTRQGVTGWILAEALRVVEISEAERIKLFGRD